VINGQCAVTSSGWSVSSAGDVNGDGLADLIVGARLSDPAAGSDAGRSYVVFGQTGGSAVDLSAIAAGSGGFVINGQCADDFSGFSVSSAGDVNGDGLADLIVGAPLERSRGGQLGRAQLRRLRPDRQRAVDLSAVAAGSGGFVINGQCAVDLSGWSVSAAGDVNGDGLADLIVGASWERSGGRQLPGAATSSSARPATALPSTSRRSPPGAAASSSTASARGLEWLQCVVGRRRQWRRPGRPDRRGARTAIPRRVLRRAQLRRLRPDRRRCRRPLGGRRRQRRLRDQRPVRG
jgi:hypothetical protein